MVKTIYNSTNLSIIIPNYNRDILNNLKTARAATLCNSSTPFLPTI